MAKNRKSEKIEFFGIFEIRKNLRKIFFLDKPPKYVKTAQKLKYEVRSEIDFGQPTQKSIFQNENFQKKLPKVRFYPPFF